MFGHLARKYEVNFETDKRSYVGMVVSYTTIKDFFDKENRNMMFPIEDSIFDYVVNGKLKDGEELIFMSIKGGMK